jgi:hypothetical protein
VKCGRFDSEKFISNNDNPGRSAIGSYIQWKEGERELDSGETEGHIFSCVRPSYE